MKAPARSRQAAIRVSVTDFHGRPLTTGPASDLGRWLARAAPRMARGAVTVALVSDREMKSLNQKYRGKNRPTDVLSFPPEARAQGTKAPVREAFLGDLAISRGVATKQARRLGHSVRVEVRILALHGLLHLLGYDHETDRGQMGRLEERLRQRLGLPSGLIARR